METDLVRASGTRVTFSDTVSRVADALTPWGAVARAYAETGAVVVEVQRLRTEGRRIEAEQLEVAARLAERRHGVTAMVRQMHREAGDSERATKELRTALAESRRAALRPGLPLAERRLLAEILKMASADLLAFHSEAGSNLTARIDQVLNGQGARESLRRSRPVGTDQPGGGSRDARLGVGRKAGDQRRQPGRGEPARKPGRDRRSGRG